MKKSSKQIQLKESLRKLVKEQILIRENQILNDILGSIDTILAQYKGALKQGSMSTYSLAEAVFNHLDEEGYDIVKKDTTPQDHSPYDDNMRMGRGFEDRDSDFMGTMNEGLNGEDRSEVNDTISSIISRNFKALDDGDITWYHVAEEIINVLGEKGWDISRQGLLQKLKNSQVTEEDKGSVRKGTSPMRTDRPFIPTDEIINIIMDAQSKGLRIQRKKGDFGSRDIADLVYDELEKNGFRISREMNEEDKGSVRLKKDSSSDSDIKKYTDKDINVELYEDIDDEDDSPDDDKIDKQATRAAKKSRKKTDKNFDNLINQKIQLEKEMQSLAKKYKEAKDSEKGGIVAKLKQKTGQKKELEVQLKKLEDAMV